jgi:protein O-mannosyl-transferase
MKTSGPIQRRKTSASTSPEQWEKLSSPLAVGIMAIALVAGVFAIYSPALNFQFVLDDHHFVNDPRLQSSGHVWEYFTSFVWSQIPGAPPSFYRPFFLLWLRLNFILSGVSPWGWHLLSIVKHVAVALLLAMLVWQLLRDRIAALTSATLFALHPAQTESVAWVTVPDPLMSAAILCALLLYLRYAARASAGIQFSTEKPNRKPAKHVRAESIRESSPMCLIVSVIACLTALMSKETAIVIPVVLFAITSFLTFGEPRPNEAENGESPSLGLRLVSAFRKNLPFFGVTLFYLLLRLNALGGRLSPQTQHLPRTTVLLSWPATLWFYVKVLFWPVRSHAYADPSLVENFSLRGVVLPALGVSLAVAVLAAICAWTSKTARRDLSVREVVGVESALLLGVSILVLPLLLTLNLNALNPGDFLHGRYTYLPLTGLLLILAAGWHLTSRIWRVTLLSAAGLLAVVFSVLTVIQEGQWKDDLTLFSQAHQDAPLNAPVARDLMRAHTDVALIQADEGKCDQAMPVFEEAIRKYPEDWYAWAGQGECFFKLHDLPKAEQSLHRASELAHQPFVTEMWQHVRESMGLPTTPP